jgi:hypothetical protein
VASPAWRSFELPAESRLPEMGGGSLARTEGVSKVLQPDFGVERRGLGTGTGPGGASPAAPRDLPKALPAAARDVVIVLGARAFLVGALGCIAALAALGVLVAYLGYGREEGLSRIVLRGFLLDGEANVPTFFVFGLLVFSAVLLALIATRAFLVRNRFRFHWALLALLMFFVGFDEAARLHEKLNEPMRAALGGSGPIHFPWVIPGAALVAVLALLYLPFLRGLPAPFGRLLLLSAALYVGGALGVEMLGAAYAEVHGIYGFGYHLITTVEETLEMLGVVVFAYALMRFLGRHDDGVRLRFRAG